MTLIETELIGDAHGQAMEVTAWGPGRIAVGHLLATKRAYPYGDRPTDRLYAEIRRIWVDPASRRSKVGQTLVAAAMDWAKRWGYTHIVVETSAREGSPGQPFFEALGFTARSVILDCPVGLNAGGPDEAR